MPPTAALADTGGSGGGDGGPGEGGSANPARRVYLSVYDHVGVTVDPVTALPHAEQGWGSDSIAFFLQQAEDRLAVGAGPGHYLGFNGAPAFDNGMNLEEFITHQCTKALDEATARGSGCGSSCRSGCACCPRSCCSGSSRSSSPSADGCSASEAAPRNPQ
ncbi:MAG TPA: hypothetical protein VKZ83_15530, partial [Phototrophicaceae bacterium]|nr:hypothetical protein [Phototrophicaceae bacterium]